VKVEGGRLRRGTPLVLDLPRPTIAARISARAIDDLLAVAACLAMFDRLAAARWKGSVGALFTRAEEVGFAGALGWVKTTRTPRATTIVNLEMSSARPHTPQGNGPILRVGDRITCFSQEVLAELEVTATALAKRDKSFRWQRALMDGGACEATVYSHAGFRTGALCLPLMNYHNHAPEGGVTREYVAAADAENLVRWMTAYAKGFRSVDGRSTRGRRLERLWRENRAALARTAREANR
jgi:endoglucanase